MNPLIVGDVIRFELRRSLSVGRIGVWVVLAAFPIGLVAVLRTQVDSQQIEVWGLTLYFLIPEVVCLLGLLLWATPAISTEIEGQTWIYLAMRPAGRGLALWGKYLTAVVWTLSTAVTSITVCVLIIGPSDPWKLWGVMCLLATLSCFGHAALYTFIGTLFYRRTMVAAVFYTLVIEFGMSFVPALVNKLTINYRLRGLLANWMDWEGARSVAEGIFGSEPSATHLVALAAMTLLLMVAAAVRLRTVEYPTQLEG